jgi:FkbM family methyltransferase
MGLSAVIACAARSCAADLPALFRNLETIAGLYERPAFVFVENDSEDETPELLRRWAAGRPDAHVLTLQGLDQRTPSRTERIAACRNAYLDFIKAGLADRDHLVVIDADEVNERPIEADAFARARDWLAADAARAAVFANFVPVYYDIFALRHPSWCPGDYQSEVKQAREQLGKAAAQKLYCQDRQIPIPLGAEPIEVRSAFGGLGIYRLGPALKSRYVGRGEDGADACEHVGFNEAVARASGGGLFILPWLAMGRTSGLGVGLPESRKLSLEQGGRTATLHAPVEHKLDRYRAAHPLYDRRLPQLAARIGQAAPGSAMLDVGANIGDTIALCRLEGCALDIVAIEASLTFFKFLELNRIKRPKLFERVEPVWAFVGQAGEGAGVELHRGTARLSRGAGPGVERAPTASLQEIVASRGLSDVALVKLDTDGFDQSIILAELDWLKATAPVLWAEADITDGSHEADWARILSDGAEAWPWLVAFDNFGFAYCAGRTAEKAGSVLDLVSYARRHKAMPNKAYGPPTAYYADIALFPARFAAVFEAFRDALPELSR